MLFLSNAEKVLNTYEYMNRLTKIREPNNIKEQEKLKNI